MNILVVFATPPRSAILFHIFCGLLVNWLRKEYARTDSLDSHFQDDNESPLDAVLSQQIGALQHSHTRSASRSFTRSVWSHRCDAIAEININYNSVGDEGRGQDGIIYEGGC